MVSLKLVAASIVFTVLVPHVRHGVLAADSEADLSPKARHLQLTGRNVPNHGKGTDELRPICYYTVNTDEEAGKSYYRVSLHLPYRLGGRIACSEDFEYDFYDVCRENDGEMLEWFFWEENDEEGYCKLDLNGTGALACVDVGFKCLGSGIVVPQSCIPVRLPSGQLYEDNMANGMKKDEL